MLRRHKALMNIENKKQEIPLHDAVRSGRKDLVHWLLHLHPELVDKVNQDGKSPLHLAAASKNVEICSILVDANADVNLTYVGSNGKASTPVDVALSRNNRSCAKYLASKGGLKASKLMSKSSLKTLRTSTNEHPTNEARHSAVELMKTRNSSKQSLAVRTTGTDLTDSETELEESLSQSQQRKRRILRKKSRHSSSDIRTPQSSNKTEFVAENKLMLVTPRIIKRSTYITSLRL